MLPLGFFILGLNKSHPGPWPGTQPPKHEASRRRSAFEWSNLAIIMSRRGSMSPICCWLILLVCLSPCPSFCCWYFLANLYTILWLLNILMYAICGFEYCCHCFLATLSKLASRPSSFFHCICIFKLALSPISPLLFSLFVPPCLLEIKLKLWG